MMKQESPTIRGLLALAVVAVFGMGQSVAAQGAPELPSYITEEYGTPPAIPRGELSQETMDALQTVFVTALRGANGVIANRLH